MSSMDYNQVFVNVISFSIIEKQMADKIMTHLQRTHVEGPNKWAGMVCF